MTQGPVLAILSAALFGISPVLAKLVIGTMSPIMLAGLLYLGSGISLVGVICFSKHGRIGELKQLSISHRLKLLGAIISGGILAPLCLAYGIKWGTAFEVSVLLNLETVATTVLAWLIFHEHIGKAVWAGKFVILLGAFIITWNPSGPVSFSVSGLLIVGACIFWGLDNNLTRDIDDLSPAVLAGVKGLVAGTFNVLLALALGEGAVEIGQGVAILGIGALSYGFSLVLFIYALRSIGSSRTSTYFASGPFIGIIFAVLLLGERPEPSHWVAAGIMLCGIFILLREYHSHSHTHEAITHRHRHIHDEHHQHIHDGNEGSEPHEHEHIHESIMHAHPHLPDIHHRHRH